MEPYKHKPDRGSMFLDGKKTRDEQPDYKGKYALPDGKIRKVAGWKTVTKSGIEYISLSFSDIPNVSEISGE